MTLDRTYLKTAWAAKVLIGEEVLQLVSGLDAVALVPFSTPEDLGNIGIVPGLDIIVALLPSVDVPLNSVTFVTNDESGGDTSSALASSNCMTQPCFIVWYLHDRIQLIPKHRADFLNRQLSASIPDEKNSTAVILFLGGQRGTLASTHRISNASPEYLTDCRDMGGEASFPDAKVGSTCFGDDNILLLEPLADSWPQPGMVDGLV